MTRSNTETLRMNDANVGNQVTFGFNKDEWELIFSTIPSDAFGDFELDGWVKRLALAGARVIHAVVPTLTPDKTT